MKCNSLTFHFLSSLTETNIVNNMTKLTLPISDETRQVYIDLCRDRYLTLAAYKAACNEQALDSYIRTHMFTQEMYAVWKESEQCVGLDTDDANIKKLQTHRKQLQTKINFMKLRLGQEAFPQRPIQRVVGNVVVQELVDEEADKVMEDGCAVCRVQHKMCVVTTLACGHAYGTKCIDRWLQTPERGCPMCRETSTTRTRYCRVAGKSRRYLTDEEADDQLEAATVFKAANTLDGDYIAF